MKLLESSLWYDITNQMYKIDMGYYTKYFDALLWCREGSVRKYGDQQKVIDSSVDIDGNFLIGWSAFESWYIFQIFQSDIFQEVVRVVRDFRVLSFQLSWKNYYAVVYRDFSDILWYYTNAILPDFEISFLSNEFTIKNKIFQSVVFHKEIVLSVSAPTTVFASPPLWIPVMDAYYFQNYFFPPATELIKDLLQLDGMVYSYDSSMVRVWVTFSYEVVVFQVSYYGKIQALSTIKKLFLSLNLHRFLLYSIEDPMFLSEWQGFENITHFSLSSIEFNFNFPKTILEHDQNFTHFQIQIAHLVYVLYSLKTSKDQIQLHNPESQDVQSHFWNLRLQKVSAEVDQTLEAYEALFQKFLQSLQLFLTSQHQK